ncbi:hypothetical protein ABZ756_07795 [Mammaliicoccus sciuri]
MNCSKCGRHLRTGSEDCPNCGEPVIYKLEKNHNVPMMILAAVLTVGALLVFIVVVFNDGNYTQKKQALFNEVDSVFSDSSVDEEYEDEWTEDEYENDTVQQEGTVVQDYTPSEEVPVKKEQVEERPAVQPVPVAADTKEYVEQKSDTYSEELEVYPDWVDTFYQDYRENYSVALNTIDFWQVEPFLSPDGSAYGEMEEYLEDIKEYGSQFDFYENRVLDYYVQNGLLYIETYEAFDLTDRYGKTTAHERDKTYKVTLNYNNYPVRIDSIEITNYYR